MGEGGMLCPSKFVVPFGYIVHLVVESEEGVQGIGQVFKTFPINSGVVVVPEDNVEVEFVFHVVVGVSVAHGAVGVVGLFHGVCCFGCLFYYIIPMYFQILTNFFHFFSLWAKLLSEVLTL